MILSTSFISMHLILSVLIIQNIFGYCSLQSVGRLGLQFVKEELYVRKHLPSQIVGNTQIVEITYKQKADNEWTQKNVKFWILSDVSKYLLHSSNFLKWFVIVERRFLPAPLARMCIFAPRFIFIVLTTWLTPYRFYASASSLFISEEINLARMTSNRFQSAWIVCALIRCKSWLHTLGFIG